MKSNLLKALNSQMKNFIDEMYQDETPLVFGDGNIDASLVLIGEAPGKQEVQQGKPFVGQAGKNLDEFITILDINRENLYITNVVKLRPYKINEATGREVNRTPIKKEINIFTSYLKRELQIIEPELVVTLGNIALKCITMDDSSSIGVLHGNPMDIKFGEVQFKLFPLYHPASIIYRADLKDIYLQDLHKLKNYLKDR